MTRKTMTENEKEIVVTEEIMDLHERLCRIEMLELSRFDHLKTDITAMADLLRKILNRKIAEANPGWKKAA